MDKNYTYLTQIHKFSSNNRFLLEDSKYVGCFYCLNIFKPSEIKEWIDNEETAKCPYCHIDSILPEEWARPSLLKDMYNRWFEETI